MCDCSVCKISKKIRRHYKIKNDIPLDFEELADEFEYQEQLAIDILGNPLKYPFLYASWICSLGDEVKMLYFQKSIKNGYTVFIRDPLKRAKQELQKYEY